MQRATATGATGTTITHMGIRTDTGTDTTARIIGNGGRMVAIAGAGSPEPTSFEISPTLAELIRYPHPGHEQRGRRSPHSLLTNPPSIQAYAISFGEGAGPLTAPQELA